jgi:hypothetical protein
MKRRARRPRYLLKLIESTVYRVVQLTPLRQL